MGADPPPTGNGPTGQGDAGLTQAGLPELGRPAPELELPDTHGTPVRLSALRGGPVLLVFFPFAFSGVCTSELSALRDRGDGLAGVRVLGVSCDPVFTLRAWSEQERFGLELLSDFWPHGAAARAYGVFDAASGHARRGSFLVDADGVLRWSVLSPAGRARDVGQYVDAARALQR